MGAYRYCLNCDLGMSMPDLSDIRAEHHICRACGYDNGLINSSLHELCDYVERLEDRIAALEEKDAQS